MVDPDVFAHPQQPVLKRGDIIGKTQICLYKGIDVATGVDEDGNKYIYVITQPYDWAKTKSITPFYYENTYTLMEDHLVVDNKATDFSGWDHAVGDQEIPAMYVVSKLNTLTYYNGTKPWTDDDEGLITIKDMEGGWGDARYINILSGNTENWALWQSEADNFGFGIFCPNTQRLIAIKNTLLK